MSVFEIGMKLTILQKFVRPQPFTWWLVVKLQEVKPSSFIIIRVIIWEMEGLKLQQI